MTVAAMRKSYVLAALVGVGLWVALSVATGVPVVEPLPRDRCTESRAALASTGTPPAESGLARVEVSVSAPEPGPAADESRDLEVLIEVVDASGRPVGEVEALADFRRMGGPQYDLDCGRAKARTDAEGRLFLSFPERADHCMLALTPPPVFAPPAYVLLFARPLSEPLRRVVLERSEPITGQVYGPDGRPVGGASVAGTWKRDQRVRQLEAECDERGRFSLPVPVSAGEVTLHIRCGGTWSSRLPGPPGLPAPEWAPPADAPRLAATWVRGVRPGTRHLAVHLGVAHRLSLRVHFGERARTRIGSIEVTPMDPRHGPPRTDRFAGDEEGTYVMDDLPAGAYAVALLFDDGLPPVRTDAYVPGPEIRITTP